LLLGQGAYVGVRLEVGDKLADAEGEAPAAAVAREGGEAHAERRDGGDAQGAPGEVHWWVLLRVVVRAVWWRENPGVPARGVLNVRRRCEMLRP
jgi:hypothetical protein